MLCSCTNPLFGKIFVLEIWAEMFSANQIAGNKNQQNSLSFCMLIQIHINQKLVKNFLGGHGKNGCGQSGHRTLKLIVSQECTDGVLDFFNAGTNSGKLKVASVIQWT